ncbi:MAG: VCBS repeat-containing protein [Flammeovirgaceae bacterium]|nr:VCBS repeat-containing protein [Flammeovirgaceae bacterium]
MLPNKVSTILFSILSFLVTNLSYSQSFTNVAASVGLNMGGNKDGGHAWADFNNDGCLDVIVNTSNGTNRSRLFLSNCDSDPDNITFTDVTSTHADGLLDRTLDRSIVWGDFNNDGYLDFARNTNNRIEVYINKGPSGSPAYSFGDANQDANYVYTNSEVSGLNSEGLGWADFNGDGFLDLIFDNHGNGTEAIAKSVSGDPCSSGFDAYTDGDLIGLTNGNGDGDYMAIGDLNDDGWPDLLVRKNDTGEDIYMNDGDGTFTQNSNLNDADADNGNKGGVAFCDFDNDGDFDIIWTDNDGNNIWENTGGSPVTFTKRAESSVFGSTITGTIDGCACGDIDNDGDIDLVLNGSNAKFLFKNNGSYSFTLSNGGISSTNDGESISMVDYDHDGDLDIYSNNDNNNELWRSDLIDDALDDKNFLKVRVVLQDPTTTSSTILGRDLIGATATLEKHSDATSVGGIQMINGGRGHGSQDPLIMHFGLPDGPDIEYDLTVKYPAVKDSIRVSETFTITPSALDDQMLVVAKPAEDFGFSACNDLVLLPMELIQFTAIIQKGIPQILWQTASETNSAKYLIEKSLDGQNFFSIGEVPAQGTSKNLKNYYYLDQTPVSGIIYYRLKMVDNDNTFEYSKVIHLISIGENAFNTKVFPNPSNGLLNVSFNSTQPQVDISIFNVLGVLIYQEKAKTNSSGQIHLKKEFEIGVYLLKINDGINSAAHKFIVN